MGQKAILVAVVVVLLLIVIWKAKRSLPTLALGAAAGAAAAICWEGARRASSGDTVGGADAPSRYTAEEERAIAALTARRQPMSALPTRVDDLEYLPYRTGAPRKTSSHFGQRKLLLSEVDFLTDHAHADDTVVYAGAAPGTHLDFLARLFHDRRLKYVLYDPRKFEVKAGRQMELHNEFFTDAVARRFAGRDDVLFISDIRTGTDDGPTPTKGAVEEDMNAQVRWVRLMNPRAAMLKFRFEYDSEPVESLVGERRLQAWAPQASTEVRLVATRAAKYATVSYSPKDHEGRMYYLNVIVREKATFEHGVPLGLVKDLDNRFDSATEVMIWKKYLGQNATPEKVANLIRRASKALSRGLTSAPKAS